MRVHTDWGTPGFTARPVADHVGPFPSAGFLSTWADHFSADGETVLVENRDALLALYRSAGGVWFAGHDDVTDYHTPLGTGVAELVAESLLAHSPGTAFRFDSLPRQAADVVASGVELTGTIGRMEQHEVAAVVDLPETFDEYLAGLDKKQRHEMRRKRRRFEAALGGASLERRAGDAAVAAFVDMHRRADGEKGTFMDERMASFFAGLHRRAGAVIDVLTGEQGRVHAMSFGFEDEDTYYLYNSAFEPEDRPHSPGIVLLELLIRTAISYRRCRMDLLKGDEPYKYRLGATPRPLYVVTGTVARSS